MTNDLSQSQGSRFHLCLFFACILFCLQAHCQSLKINNCPQLISEFGYEAVSRDNICKTQCSFVLNALDPAGGAGGVPRPNFFIESDTLQAPGFFGNINVQINDNGNNPRVNPDNLPESNLKQSTGSNNNNGRPFRYARR